MVKTVSPIVEPVAPIELPSNTVPSARIKNAFIFTPKKKTLIPSGDNNSSNRMNVFVLISYTVFANCGQGFLGEIVVLKSTTIDTFL